MTTTAEAITSTGVSYGGLMYGSWPTAAAEGIHTITLPRHIAYIEVHGDVNGTNPFLIKQFLGQATNAVQISGSTTVITSAALAAGITITNNTDGTCTVAVAVEVQVNDGVNSWWAITKA